MTDGVTPRCIYCGETMDLVDHLQRLNAHEAFVDFMHQTVPDDAAFRVNTKCGACREDPERAIEMISRVSPEELRARMRGEWNR